MERGGEEAVTEREKERERERERKRAFFLLESFQTFDVGQANIYLITNIQKPYIELRRSQMI
jgi:hypothetical protein